MEKITRTNDFIVTKQKESFSTMIKLLLCDLVVTDSSCENNLLQCRVRLCTIYNRLFPEISHWWELRVPDCPFNGSHQIPWCQSYPNHSAISWNLSRNQWNWSTAETLVEIYEDDGSGYSNAQCCRPQSCDWQCIPAFPQFKISWESRGRELKRFMLILGMQLHKLMDITTSM